MNRRPTCEEAAPREAGGDSLVQIGLPTGTRSTGFEATRRDVLSLMGFSLGAAWRRGMPRARPARGAAAGGVDGDGARRAEPLRDHLRRVQRRLRPRRQAARRTSDQDRGQRRVAADGRRDLRGGPGQRAVAVRRRTAARAGVAGQPGVVARDRPSHPDRAGCAGPRCARRRAAVADDHQPVDARAARRAAGRLPEVPARHLRHDVAGGAARGEPALSRRGRGAALPVRSRARRRGAGGRLPRDLAGAGRVRAPVGAAAARDRRARPRASTCSAKPACRSRAATPTSASPSRRRRSAQSRSRCSPPSAVASATRAWSGRPSRASAGWRGTLPRSSGPPRRWCAAAANRWSCRAATMWRRRSWWRS